MSAIQNVTYYAPCVNAAEAFQDIEDPALASGEDIKANIGNVVALVSAAAAIYFLLTTFLVLTFATGSALSYLIPAFLSLIVLKFSLDWAKERRVKADTLRIPQEILRKFENYSEIQMKEFLIQNQIDPTKIPIDNLSSRPFKVLIANYLYLLECNNHYAKAKALESNPNFISLSLTGKCDPQLFQKVNQITLKNKIMTACLLQRMYYPRNPVTLELSLNPRGQSRPTITSQELIYLSIPQIRKILFEIALIN